MQLLLAKGVDPNHLGKDPMSYSREETTPLKVALQKENLDAAQLLLDYGADIKASCLNGMVVGAMAEAVKVTADYEESKARAERGKKEAETGIIRTNEAEQIVQFAGKAKANAEKKEKVVHFLVESGADLNVTGDTSDKSKGGSPLMYAAQVGRTDYLQLLLDHGAEIDLQNASGDTALMKAVEANKLEVAAFLLDKGADVGVENKKGFTPYWLAKRNDNQEMTNLLVRHGAETLSYNAHVVKFSALKAIGLVPSGTSPADISPKQFEHYHALISTQLGTNNPEKYKPDPRLSSPVKTWELHKQAVINGDFALLKKTLTRPDHPMIEIFEKLDPEKRRKLVQEMRPIEFIKQDNDSATFRMYRTSKDEEITFYINFTKMLGEWKIEDY
jgi:ankyrin repeat protein